MRDVLRVFFILLFMIAFSFGQETHEHGTPEKLGKVHFPTSCAPAVQGQFDRGVALLHSFAYSLAEKAFREVTQSDPQCAMAHWGIAMTYFHQLWEPRIEPASITLGQAELKEASKMGGLSEKERRFVDALTLVYDGAPEIPYPTRARKYEYAMKEIAVSNKDDLEAQVFYALALLANVSPADQTHAKQKEAAELLERCYRIAPQHPGIPHYLIHAYDNVELAGKGDAAARAYSQIAPSSPHALHMPSHIFTRLGLWEDSIKSNVAAGDAAHRQGDIGEELHSMDYLVYAYLQASRDQDAMQVIQRLNAMTDLNKTDFKVGYAATAMPIRYVVERGQWAEAATIVPPATAPAQVLAIAVWARGLGLARTGHAAEARSEAVQLKEIETELLKSGNEYWGNQAGLLSREVLAWAAQADNKTEEAAALLREAADSEDAIEKLPVTPGPIVPAREQLGDLLLQQKRPDLALKEFNVALVNAPGRRGALRGKADAARELAPPKP